MTKAYAHPPTRPAGRDETLPATRRICTGCHGQRMAVTDDGRPVVCPICNGDGVELLELTGDES